MNFEGAIVKFNSFSNTGYGILMENIYNDKYRVFWIKGMNKAQAVKLLYVIYHDVKQKFKHIEENINEVIEYTIKKYHITDVSRESINDILSNNDVELKLVAMPFVRI